MLLQIARMKRVEVEHAEVAIGSGPARIVIVSDSHSAPHPSAWTLAAERHPAAILHAGDVGAVALLDDLDAIAPTHAVRGNIDDRSARLPEHLVIDVARAGQAQLRILLTHVGVAGPRLRQETRARARALGAAIVVCGHSHVPLIVQDGDLVVFNPGSCGPRRFNLPITIGVLELGAEDFTLQHVDCETGTLWRPPCHPDRGAGSET